MHNKSMKKEGNLAREDGAKLSPGDLSSDSDSLHFKGLISGETTGFGVAIWREEDGCRLFHMKKSLDDSFITVLEAELIALKRCLTEAVNLGINHISICCRDYRVFEFLMERSTPKQENIALLMNDVQHIRQQLTSSIPVLVSGTQAMSLAQNKTSRICLESDIEAAEMLSVAFCNHRSCEKCLKRHIEEGLLDGKSVPKCPEYGCKSNLDRRSCAHLLTPKLQKLWERHDPVPECDIFHCPNPSCSALMSKTKLFESTEEEGVRRCCFICCTPFCINCKVPWHSNLSCDEFKRSVSKLSTTGSRQCRSCQHRIILLLSEERNTVTCRYYL